MLKPLKTGCVALALVLASAGGAAAAPGTPDASPQRDARPFADEAARLGLQVEFTAGPVAAGADHVAPASTAGTTLGSTTVADTPPATIPLPAGVYVGLVGLASTFAAWRRFKRRRI